MGLFFLLAVIVICLAIYVGNVLFGDRSLIVLKNLQKEKAFLYEDTKRLQDENAYLQKLYLERTSLDKEVEK
ncbi:MAG: hypothetical protein GXZ15_04485 [Campylobacter sp.]|nr:hypothetical protein [Campylobacter sp.]